MTERTSAASKYGPEMGARYGRSLESMVTATTGQIWGKGRRIGFGLKLWMLEDLHSER
jgi:hypothetical protein